MKLSFGFKRLHSAVYLILAVLLSMVAMRAFSADADAQAPISHASNLMQMMLGLAAVIVMIFVVVWLIKRVGYTGYQTAEMMKIKGCLPLSTKEKLLLVEVGSEQVLIGVAPGFVGHIKTLDKPIGDAAKTDSTKNNAYEASPVSSLFAEKLKTIINKGETVE